MTDGAAEARRTALDERVRLALQRAQRLLEQPAQFDDARKIFVGTGLAFDASPREHLDILGQRAQLFAAELARFAFQRVRGHDEAARIAGAHRLFDRGDRLGAVLAKIAENPHESRTQLGARRAKRSEEHTSELQSLMRISYAVSCLKQKNTN